MQTVLHLGVSHLGQQGIQILLQRAPELLVLPLGGPRDLELRPRFYPAVRISIIASATKVLTPAALRVQLEPLQLYDLGQNTMSHALSKTPVP